MRKGAWFFWSVIILALVGSLFFDAEIARFISLMRHWLLDDFFMGITFVSSELIIFFFLTALFLWKDRKRKWILPLWMTLLSSVIVSFVLKILVQRPRPYQVGIVAVQSVLEKAGHAVWNFSFPSFQTMMVFSAIPILSKEFPKLKLVWILFAALVGFSRIYFGLHFLSDIIVGGAVGYLLGLLFVWFKEKKF
jgi:undecaprenyl-diphosphatase